MSRIDNIFEMDLINTIQIKLWWNLTRKKNYINTKTFCTNAIFELFFYPQESFLNNFSHLKITSSRFQNCTKRIFTDREVIKLKYLMLVYMPPMSFMKCIFFLLSEKKRKNFIWWENFLVLLWKFSWENIFLLRQLLLIHRVWI